MPDVPTTRDDISDFVGGLPHRELIRSATPDMMIVLREAAERRGMDLGAVEHWVKRHHGYVGRSLRRAAGGAGRTVGYFAIPTRAIADAAARRRRDG